MYSLWQSNVQLGRLIDEKEESIDGEEVAGFSGWLLPVADLSAYSSVQQTRFSGLPDCPVVHESAEDCAPEVYSDGESIRCTYPLPAFMRIGVPGREIAPESVFSIRTDEGEDVPTYRIVIERHDFGPEIDIANDLREVGLPTHLRCLFRVGFVFDHAYPPRAFMERIKIVLEEQRDRMDQKPGDSADES